METLENWQKTEVFDIKRQNVERLDEKTIEKLQKQFILNFDVNKNIVPVFSAKCWLESDNYYKSKISIRSPFAEVFKECAKNLITWYDSYWNCEFIVDKNQINSKVIPLIVIKQAFIKDWKYYFYSSDGQIISANLDDFDQNWVYARSLDFYWNQLFKDDFEGKTCKEIVINNVKVKSWWDGFVHLYEWSSYKKHSWQLPWDNVFQIDWKSILVQDGWRLHQYKISSWGYYDKLQVINPPFKWIKQMFVDYNENFLLIVNESDWVSKLHIINYNDFVTNNVVNDIYQIENVDEVVWLWQGAETWLQGDNWMICKMTNWSLQYYWNTFSKFRRHFFNPNEWKPWKLIYPKEENVVEVSDNGKNELLKSLENWEISIDLEDDVDDQSNKIDNSIIEKIWELKLNIDWNQYSLKELFDTANDEKTITLVYYAFQKIKNNPDIVKYGSVLKWMERKIVEKKNKIILGAIFSELWDLVDKLWTAADLATLITIQEKWKEIKKKRRSIQAGIVDEDKDLDNLLKVVDEKIRDYQEEHREEYETELEDNLQKIAEILEDVRNAIDISIIYDEPIYLSTKQMITNLSSESRDKYNKKLKEVINKRRDELRNESEKIKKEEKNRIESMKKDVEEDIEQIKETIDDIDSIESIEQFKESDAFVQRIKEMLAELPSSDAQKLDLKLDRIFSERIFKLRLWWEESKWVIQNLDSYWIDTMLYYNEDWTEKVDWKIEWKENANWTIWLVAKLMNWETHEYNKWTYLKDAEKFDTVIIGDDAPKFDMTFEEFTKFNKKLSKYKRSWKEELKALSKKYQNETDPVVKKELKEKLKERKEYYKEARYTEALIYNLIKQQKLNPRSKVPPFDPFYIVLDEEKEILKNLSARLVDQKQNSGIEILEWWPGLWKTVMCEFLANVTNREIVRVQCSKMDPSDMFFSPTLKKNETTREPADWIKLMQKPGTIILFDEIDKLNDQCFERLHSLFDRSRSVYDPQLWSIKANQDCLFLWTRNSYDRLSNPILSRWRILQINYPWELNEAFKISKYSTSTVLNKMSYEEFEMLYDKYITRWESAPTSVQERSIYELVQNINHLLNIFNKLRELYWAEEPFAYELSYRDARQIFVDYNSSWNFKTALENVLVPKARWAVIAPDEKKEQEEMVRSAINEEMWF